MAQQSSKNTTPQKRVRRTLVVVGFLLLGAILFATIYNDVRNSDDLAHLDQPVLQWMMAHRSPFLTDMMLILTNLMSPVGFAGTVIIGASIWAWRRKEYWRPSLLMGAMTLALLTSTTIKNLVERGRPPVIDMVPPFELDFAFPSGHTIGIATCLLVAGYLVYSRHRTHRVLVAWGSAAIIGTALVAFSRLYLGYHWITDVSASVGLAIIILALVIAVDPLRPKKSKVTSSSSGQ